MSDEKEEYTREEIIEKIDKYLEHRSLSYEQKSYLITFKSGLQCDMKNALRTIEFFDDQIATCDEY